MMGPYIKPYIQNLSLITVLFYYFLLSLSILCIVCIVCRVYYIMMEKQVIGGTYPSLGLVPFPHQLEKALKPLISLHPLHLPYKRAPPPLIRF